MNLTKQTKKLAMIAAMGATVISSTAANSATVTFAGGDVSSSIGSSITLDLVGRDFANGTTGGNLIIDFDPSVLQVTSSAINTAIFDFSQASGVNDNVNGTITLGFSSFFNEPASLVDTLFANISFDVIGASAGPLAFGLSDNLLNPNFISSWTYDTGLAATGVYCVKGSGNNGGDPGCSAYPVEERLEFITTNYDVAAVPVPAAVWLFGSGLIGLVAVSRRKAA